MTMTNKNNCVVKVFGNIAKIDRKEITTKNGNKMAVADIYMRNEYSYTRKVKDGFAQKEMVESGVEMFMVTALDSVAHDICSMFKDNDYIELECYLKFVHGVSKKTNLPYNMINLGVKNILISPKAHDSEDNLPF